MLLLSQKVRERERDGSGREYISNQKCEGRFQTVYIICRNRIESNDTSMKLMYMGMRYVYLRTTIPFMRFLVFEYMNIHARSH